MLQRTLLLLAMMFLSASTAQADYVIVRINVNQLNFIPTAPPGFVGGGAPGANIGVPPGANVGGVPGANIGVPPGAIIGGLPGNIAGGAAGMPAPAFLGFFPGGMGFGGGGQPQPGEPNPTPGLPGVMPEEPNARIITSVIEMRNYSKPMPTPFGLIFKYDHDWGSNNWLLLSPLAPTFAGQFEAKSFNSEFMLEFSKARGTKNVEELLHLARRCVAHGKLSRFHSVMEEAVKLDPKHLNVKNYQKVQRDLAKVPSTEDPAQRELTDRWRVEDKYRPHTSKKGRYRIYAHIIGSDKALEKSIERRLAMFDDLLETFYHWFAIQRDNTNLPAMPKHILPVLLTGFKTEMSNRRLQWGNEPMSTEGFTPRRDNVIIMPAKVRENDSTFTEFERILEEKIRSANEKFSELGIRVTMTKENLLSGKVTEPKEAGKAAAFIAIAQTAVALWHSQQIEAERHAVTHEGVRQLLTASNMFPRNVQTPEWLVVGLATLLETPAGAVHPTIGTPSWTHLVSFKHYRNNVKILENPSQVMQAVVSDKFFHEARRLAKLADESPNEKSIFAARESWELASSTSWALVYYLSQSNRLDHFFKYGKELDKLPRDLDLSSAIMEGCLAKAFDIADARDPRRINRTRFDALAVKWFEVMQGANLDHPKLQGHFERVRAMRAGLAAPGGVISMPAPIPGQPGVVPPVPVQPPNPGGGNPGNPGVVPPNPGNPGGAVPPRVPPRPGAGAG